MSIDNLINELTDEGVKKPLPAPWLQALYWFIPTLVFTAIVTYALGVRPDIDEKLSKSFYIGELLSLGLAIWFFTMTAFCYSRPDLYQRPWMIWVSFATLILPIIFGYMGASDFLTMVNFHESLHDHMGAKCAKCITICAIPPILALFIMLRLGASPRPGITGLLAAVASTLFSYSILRVHEPNDNPAHIIIWHVVPVFVIAIIGVIAGYIFLKWKK